MLCKLNVSLVRRSMNTVEQMSLKPYICPLGTELEKIDPFISEMEVQRKGKAFCLKSIYNKQQYDIMPYLIVITNRYARLKMIHWNF